MSDPSVTVSTSFIGADTMKLFPTQDEKRKTTINPAEVNKDFRATHSHSEKCRFKIVTNSRIFGTRGTTGSTLAKSATRLAIDVGLITPVEFQKTAIKSQPGNKPIVYDNISNEKAVQLLDRFEKICGGKADTAYKSGRNKYNEQKKKTLQELGLKTNSEGKVLYPSDQSQKDYFSKMENMAFPYWELYISVTPEEGRTTRSRSCRFADKKELDKMISALERELN